MKPIRIQPIISLIVVICFMVSCKTTVPVITLTPAQLAVQMANGNQATTLELMSTHVSVATLQIPTEYLARVKAVELNADVAQLISTESSESSYGGSYSGYTSTSVTRSYTYRFWKKK